MKTNTHFLYSFIIFVLVLIVIYMSVAKPKVESPRHIETTAPVESPLPLETTPPVETHTECTINENSEKVYHDKYFIVAHYLLYFLFIFSLSVCWAVVNVGGYSWAILGLLSVILYISLIIVSIVSMVHDTLHVAQYIILSLQIIIPLVFYVEYLSLITLIDYLNGN